MRIQHLITVLLLAPSLSAQDQILDPLTTSANTTTTTFVQLDSNQLAPQIKTYKITNHGTCLDIDYPRITVGKNLLFVPNVFSHHTDRIVVRDTTGSVTEILDFRIYDRWGELLYETKNFRPNDYSVGWDGTYKGKLLNPGVFVWMAQFRLRSGYKRTEVGQITLIR